MIPWRWSGLKTQRCEASAQTRSRSYEWEPRCPFHPWRNCAFDTFKVFLSLYLHFYKKNTQRSVFKLPKSTKVLSWSYSPWKSTASSVRWRVNFTAACHILAQRDTSRRSYSSDDDVVGGKKTEPKSLAGWPNTDLVSRIPSLQDKVSALMSHILEISTDIMHLFIFGTHSVCGL